MRSYYRSLLAAGAVVVAVLGLSAGPVAPQAKPPKGTAVSRAIEAFDKVGGAYGIRLLGGKEFAATAKRLGYDERSYYYVLSLAFGRPTGKEPLGDDGLAALAEHIAAFPGLE